MVFHNWDPVFKFSIYFRTGVSLFLMADGLGLGIFGLSYPNPNHAWSIYILFSSVGVGLLIAYQSLSLRVWKADFYDNYFEIKGWRFKKSLSYADIDDVIVVNGPLSTVSLAIRLKGKGGEILRLFKNPWNSELGTDLQGWLNEKIGVARQD
jgi:hypothetical protein